MTGRLHAATLRAFADYIAQAEKAMELTLHQGPFLWALANPEVGELIREGGVTAEFSRGRAPLKVPHGLIHDWIGALFIPGVSMKQTLALIQDYDNHKNVYQPDVIDSALLSQKENDFRIYLRLLKKKIVTVILDTDHDVHYQCISPQRWLCRSSTTRVAEVQDAGTFKERVLPPDTGHGFLWRLSSYWRFETKDNGVYLECRAISLTADIPFGLAWLIAPIIQNLPRESLIHTLEATRRALRP